MAFGSGSSLASDRWMRRRGLPSSAQLFNVGNASLLHQHSSQKPTAHVSGLAFATLINRSLAKLAFFSFVEGVGGGDPPLGSHPSHSQKASQSGPDGLPGDSPLGESLFESGLGRHLQGPKARFPYPNSLGERWSISLKVSRSRRSVHRRRRGCALGARSPP